MIFLNHLYFFNESIDFNKGLMIGNSIKNRNLPKYNLEVLKGMAVDMQIRLMAGNDIGFLRSSQRIKFNPKYNKYSYFIINIFYDHFLAKNWDRYSEITLGEFSEKIYKLIQDDLSSFPYKIRKFAPEMISKKWITAAANIEGVHQYLKLVSKSEQFTFNLDTCISELIEDYKNYGTDFEEYFASLIEFMNNEADRFHTVSNEKEMMLLIA